MSNGVVTQSSNNFGHGFPFSSDAGDFAGTDQIYVGSGQTAAHDGYSTSSQRINGPDVLVMNYSPLVGPGQVVTSLTLGIAADDFQFPAFGQPYIVTLNGRAAPALTGALEALNETGPFVHFFTIGLSTSLDNPSHTLTLSIDEGGDGGDGWAIDFATVGVTTSSASGVPEPATVVLLGAGLAALCFRWGRRFACHGRG